MFLADKAALVAACQRLAATPHLRLDDLYAFAAAAVVPPALLQQLLRADSTHPYGRNVLFADDALEVMVATWTRGMPCEAHDHGGSVGAVRVLQGRGWHRVWQVADGCLRERAAHPAISGEVLTVGANMVHSLGDDDDDVPLVTLHLYTRAIDHMVVYDRANHRTLQVAGSCGAWVPPEGSPLRLASYAGILARHALPTL